MWQLIETAPAAPESGEPWAESARVLLYVPASPEGHSDAHQTIGWRNTEGDWHGDGGFLCQPSHWRPLDPPPADEWDDLQPEGE